jgi:hypothetical protein
MQCLQFVFIAVQAVLADFPLRAKMGGRNGIFKAQECSQSVSSPTLETW